MAARLIAVLILAGVWFYTDTQQSRRIASLEAITSFAKPEKKPEFWNKPNQWQSELRSEEKYDWHLQIGNSLVKPYMSFEDTTLRLRIICVGSDPCEIFDQFEKGKERLMGTVDKGKLSLKNGYSRAKIESRILMASLAEHKSFIDGILQHPEQPRTYPRFREW